MSAFDKSVSNVRAFLSGMSDLRDSHPVCVETDELESDGPSPLTLGDLRNIVFAAEGMALAPAVPTEKMLFAAIDRKTDEDPKHHPWGGIYQAIWTAMLGAVHVPERSPNLPPAAPIDGDIPWPTA